MSQVPGYDLLSVIGKGGAAEVWRAERLADGAEVAVKLGHAATEHARRRFEVEAEALAEVGPPHTLELLDSGVCDDGRPFLVVGLITTGTLADAIAQRSRPLPIDEIADIGAAVLDALAAVHDKGIVHRDLKPANIVISGEPAVASLMDFGLALGTEAADVTRTGVGVGTPKYVAPEQLRAEDDIDRRADIYSFGILLYQLATGSVPFDGTADAVEYGHLTLRPPSPRKRAPLPSRLESLILECLEKDPNDRPADARVARDWLVAACAAAEPTTDPDDAPTSRVPTRKRAASSESIALLSCRAPARALALVDTVVRRGGFLIANRGARFLFGFGAHAVDSPARAAVFAAIELSAELATSIAVHLDSVDIARRDAVVPLVAGPSITDPELWLPRGSWTGVRLTAAAADAVGSAVPDPDAPGFSRPRDRDGDEDAGTGERTIIGRARELASARASWRACFETRSPRSWTLVGEPGLGKTRIAGEIAQSIELETDAEVHHLSGREEAELDRLLESVRESAAAAPVALVVDDLHLLSNRALDRLEYAALDQPGVSLWLAATAAPQLSTIRPGWGQRAAHAVKFLLPPMPETDAMELAARWLEPAEYPPADVLRTLVRWAGCAPASLEQLARTLVREGFVRPRGRGESYYLATPELSAFESSPAIEWLATRALADLPQALAELLQICAALEPPFSPEQVEAIQRGLDTDDTEVAHAKAGIAELSSRGVLRELSSGAYELASSLVRRGVEALLSPQHRRAIHEQATAQFSKLLEPVPDGALRWQLLSRLARHAAESGQQRQAAAAFLELGTQQLAAHSNLDAEVALSRAVELASDREVALRALLLRGRVRYRIDRVDDSLADLASVRELAAADGAGALIAEALLEEAAAFDWAERFDDSAAAIERAAPIVDRLGDDRLAAQLSAARGRSHWRMSRPEQAADELGRAARAAELADCDEARTVAGTLLPLALLRCGRLDDCESEFARSIAQFERRGDRFHLAAVLVNRMFLWSAREAPDKGRDDLRRAIAIARELGNPQLERGAVYNLAEDLYWSGDDDESTALAERARALRRKFWPDAVAVDELLLARICAARGQLDRARDALAETGWTPGDGEDSFQLLGAAVSHSAFDADPDSWSALVARADAVLPPDEALEVRYLCAQSLRRRGDDHGAAQMIAGAAPGLEQAPIWRSRFDALAPPA